MEAREEAFYFIQSNMMLEIPFFQRSYVWNEENWQELIDNLCDNKQSHFLGSIILKQKYVPTGELPCSLVIDGQQRLTTLSILLRACYDSLNMEKFNELRNEITTTLDKFLFYKERGLSSKKEVKIKHSMVDSLDYKKVITGEMKDKLDEIILNSEAKNIEKASSNIMQCYKFFVSYLINHETQCESLWEDLVNENIKTIVKIDLKEDENEQAIFDTINSAGVRLTCFDTIKNALFQKAIENAVNDSEKEAVIALYKSCWESIFSNSSDNVEYWNTERPLGRFMRSNQEILLHCVALINGFYDPEINKISDLSQLYKKYIDKLNNKELFKFIKEIVLYADIYRKNFFVFNKSTYFEYDEPIKRLFHILHVCEVSTFHPYILKLLKDFNISEGSTYTDEFLNKLKEIEIYVIRHYVCQVSTKNFNKDCAALVKGKTTIPRLLSDKDDYIGDSCIISNLKGISKNKIASLILFWIELKRRYEDSKVNEKNLKYTYSLEHIMPQKWKENWSIDVLPVKDILNNCTITDVEQAEEVRNLAIHEIGNMTLLNSNLNSSLRNYEFKRKVDGEGRKKGIKDYDSLYITKEILKMTKSKNSWDESDIRLRTEELTKEFLEMW